MFGDRYYGPRFFGDRYFGDGAAGAPPDTTPPTLSSPSGTSAGPNSAVGNVDTDEANGTLYWVVTTSASSPSAAQVQAGQDHLGNPAVYAGSKSVTATGTQTAPAAGLTPETTYYFHFQQQDLSANDSTVSTSASFDTDALGSANRLLGLLDITNISNLN